MEPPDAIGRHMVIDGEGGDDLPVRVGYVKSHGSKYTVNKADRTPGYPTTALYSLALRGKQGITSP